jgi:hypothetical protein
MKKFVYALSVLALLSTACSKQPTEIAATDSTHTATTDSSVRDTSGIQRETTGLTVKVSFVGLVCHIWDKREAGVERAIVLRTPVSGSMHHNRTIGLPPESKPDVVRLNLPIENCPDRSTCTVRVDGLAFRFVDVNGTPPSARFSPNANFTNFVTHLKDVPHAAHPFENKSNLIDAVFDPTPKSNDPVVAGWFELAGGRGDADKFLCQGKFEGEQGGHDFVQIARVTFALPTGAKLQVFKAGDSQWRDIAIPSSSFEMTLDNDAATPMHVSHFEMYAKLHKKMHPQDPDIVLPRVVLADNNTCLPRTSTAGEDAVPGCSNSSWP